MKTHHTHQLESSFSAPEAESIGSDAGVLVMGWDGGRGSREGGELWNALASCAFLPPALSNASPQEDGSRFGSEGEGHSEESQPPSGEKQVGDGSKRALGALTQAPW